MIKQIFTKKGNLDQLFVGLKRQVVTWLDLPTQVVTKINPPTEVLSGCLQVAIGQKNTPPNKPLTGHLKTAKIKYQPEFIREIKINDQITLSEGEALPIDQIVGEGDTVKVTGTSKGQGFAGVIKRHNFGGGPRTHGQSDRQRAPGSIGRGTTPGRVVKGKKMAGHMGHETISVQNLKIVKLDLENNKMAVSGPVPGIKNSLVTVTVIKKHA